MTGRPADRRTLPDLGDHLRRIGSARDRGERAAAFTQLADEADRHGAAGYLLDRLLSRGRNGQRFALEVAARLPTPLPSEHLYDLIDLVESPRTPTRLRVPAAAQIIRSVPIGSPVVERLVDALRRNVSPSRAMNRLRRLAALVPPPEPLSRALAELDGSTTAPCPRCGARLGPDDLVRHLWERHRLLLEDGRVREPWDVIGEWVTDFARTNRPEFLDRACELAQALDPTDGLSRVHRLLLAGGTDDEEAHALLRAEAAEKNATLCPHCYALVPQPTQAVPTPVLVGSGRVDGGGFRVELTDRYLINFLRAETPEMTVFAGPEPGRALTRRGAVLAFLLPLTVLAIAFAFLPRVAGVPPVVLTGGLLVAAAFAYLGVQGTWRDTGNPADRAVNHAWTILVPRMLAREGRKADAAFVAGLAVASRGRGTAELREDQVRRAIDKLRSDRPGVPYVTPLSVLRIADAAAAGADDLPLIADDVGESLDGALPLDHAEGLLKELRGNPTDTTRRVRLRVLILTRAFAAGLEAEDLRLIGQVCPTLGTAYASEDRVGLARLRLLWLYRPRRLWQRIGSATAVFDLARYPKLAENYLRWRPDLLLFQASGGAEEAAPILVCEEGVVYRDVVITDPHTPIRVRARSLVRGGGYELTIDERVYKFREDPTLLARRLKGWTAFLFREFLPRARLLTRRRSEQGDRLLLQKLTSCPECRKTFLGLTGEIGLATLPAAVDGVET
jgi:hypothetical protein